MLLQIMGETCDDKGRDRFSFALGSPHDDLQHGFRDLDAWRSESFEARGYGGAGKFVACTVRRQMGIEQWLGRQRPGFGLCGLRSGGLEVQVQELGGAKDLWVCLGQAVMARGPSQPGHQLVIFSIKRTSHTDFVHENVQSPRFRHTLAGTAVQHTVLFGFPIISIQRPPPSQPP